MEVPDETDKTSDEGEPNYNRQSYSDLSDKEILEKIGVDATEVSATLDESYDLGQLEDKKRLAQDLHNQIRATFDIALNSSQVDHEPILEYEKRIRTIDEDSIEKLSKRERKDLYIIQERAITETERANNKADEISAEIYNELMGQGMVDSGDVVDKLANKTLNYAEGF